MFSDPRISQVLNAPFSSPRMGRELVCVSTHFPLSHQLDWKIVVRPVCVCACACACACILTYDLYNSLCVFIIICIRILYIYTHMGESGTP